MEPIQTLLTETSALFAAFVEAIRKDSFKSHPSSNEMKTFVKTARKYETLEQKIKEEQLVLQSQLKDTSCALKRYNARLQVIRDTVKNLVESVTPKEK